MYLIILQKAAKYQKMLKEIDIDTFKKSKQSSCYIFRIKGRNVILGMIFVLRQISTRVFFLAILFRHLKNTDVLSSNLKRSFPCAQLLLIIGIEFRFKYSSNSPLHFKLGRKMRDNFRSTED